MLSLPPTRTGCFCLSLSLAPLLLLTPTGQPDRTPIISFELQNASVYRVSTGVFAVALRGGTMPGVQKPEFTISINNAQQATTCQCDEITQCGICPGWDVQSCVSLVYFAFSVLFVSPNCNANDGDSETEDPGSLCHLSYLTSPSFRLQFRQS
ncbi:hypothetical protein K456DRAFT_481531 [Colletotrichum gloeosporioides 23]|nr:hypothetical protein K456DRAFT_481531 [Colletotrichum gloeosporioides 23]